MNEIVHVHVYSSAHDAQYARFLDLLQARFLGSAKLNGNRLFHAELAPLQVQRGQGAFIEFELVALLRQGALAEL